IRLRFYVFIVYRSLFTLFSTRGSFSFFRLPVFSACAPICAPSGVLSITNPIFRLSRLRTLYRGIFYLQFIFFIFILGILVLFTAVMFIHRVFFIFYLVRKKKINIWQGKIIAIIFTAHKKTPLF